MKFSEEHILLGDLKPGDTYLTKSNGLGMYVGQLDNGGHMIKNVNTGELHEVPHGRFPVFKKIEEDKTYDNTFKKSDYVIKQIDKSIAYDFVRKHHYLGDAKFFSKFAYGLFGKEGDILLGITAFSNPQGNVALKGWFGLENSDQTVLELSRLCVLPQLNGTNATSFLLSTSIKLLKKESIRAVITLADDSRHSGSIYQVCNFTYYGLTDKKTDFFSYDDGGKVNPRGATKDKQGVWINRTRKHRYAYILDKTLKCNYEEQKRPEKEDTNTYDCCNGTEVITDKRFNVNYTCPKCTGKLDIV